MILELFIDIKEFKKALTFKESYVTKLDDYLFAIKKKNRDKFELQETWFMKKYIWNKNFERL